MTFMKSILILSALSLTAMACGSGTTDKTNSLGGISVGNPTGEMTWSGSSVSIHFDKSLSIDTSSERAIKISNQRLLTSKGPTSSFQLEVVSAPGEAGLRNQEDLKNFVRTREKKALLKELKKGTGRGYLVEATTNKTQRTERAYLMGANGAVVMITTAIASSTVGTALIEAIPNTIDFDVKAPVIKAIRFSTTKIKAGEKIEVELDIEDDSDLSDESLKLTFSEISAPQNSRAKGFFKEVEFSHRNQNTYYTSIRTSELLASGKYQITNIAMNDTWLNITDLFLDLKTGEYLESLSTETLKQNDEVSITSKLVEKDHKNSGLKNVPVLEVTNNETQDLEFPQIKSVMLQKTTVESGEEIVLELVADDDTLHLEPLRVGVEVAIGSEDQSMQASNSAATEVTDDGVILVRIQTPKFAEPGTIKIKEIRVGDASGKLTTLRSLDKADQKNYLVEHTLFDSSLDISADSGKAFLESELSALEKSNIDILAVQMENHGAVDRQAPRWTASRLEKNGSDHIGNWNWQVEVLDDLGLEETVYLIVSKVPEAKEVVQEFTHAFSESLPLEKLGDNLYQVDLTALGESLKNRDDYKAGNYLITGISFEDRSGKNLRFKAFRKGEIEEGFVFDESSKTFRVDRRLHNQNSKVYEIDTTWHPFTDLSKPPSAEQIKNNGQFPVIEFTVK